MKKIITFLFLLISTISYSQYSICGKTPMDDTVLNNVYVGGTLQGVQNVMLDMSHSFKFLCDSGGGLLNWSDTNRASKAIASQYYTDSVAKASVDSSNIKNYYSIFTGTGKLTAGRLHQQGHDIVTQRLTKITGYDSNGYLRFDPSTQLYYGNTFLNLLGGNEWILQGSANNYVSLSHINGLILSDSAKIAVNSPQVTMPVNGIITYKRSGTDSSYLQFQNGTTNTIGSLNSNSTSSLIQVIASAKAAAAILLAKNISTGFTGQLTIKSSSITAASTDTTFKGMRYDKDYWKHADSLTIPDSLDVSKMIKADLGSYLPLAGGTMTGNITMSNVTYVTGSTGNNSKIDMNAESLGHGAYDDSIMQLSVGSTFVQIFNKSGGNAGINLQTSVGASIDLGNQIKLGDGTGKYLFKGNTFFDTIYTANATASHKDTIPNKSGTFAFTNDIPTSLPPTGTAGGDLSGTYPNPAVFQAHLTDQVAPSTPSSGTIILQSFNQQGFSVPHVYDSKGDAIEITRDNIFIARNNTGSAINKGKVVYILSSTGTVPTIALAKANSLTTLGSIGVTYDSVGNNSFVRVMMLGFLEHINLSAFSNGDALYVDPTTAGELTNVKPTSPNYAQIVGHVVNNGIGNGVLQVYTRAVEAVGTTLSNGALGRIAYYSGSSALGFSASLYWDTTRHYLGIQNSSPKAALVIGSTLGAGPTPNNMISIGNSAGNSRLRVGQDSTHYGGFVWNYNATPANATLQINTNGTTALTVDQSQVVSFANAFTVPNGSTATTQALNTNDTKVATDGYVYQYIHTYSNAGGDTALIVNNGSNRVDTLTIGPAISYSVTPVGFQATPTGTGSYTLRGRSCMVQINITGTSNSSSFSFNLPFKANSTGIVTYCVGENNSALGGDKVVNTTAGSTSCTLGITAANNLTGWTSSGTKAFNLQFSYIIQ